MNIYSYSKDDNKYKKEIESIIKNNFTSLLIFHKVNKLKKIINNHPESTLSDYEVIILSNKKNLTLLQICAYYSTPDIIDSLFKIDYFGKKEKIIKERFYYSDENEEFVDDKEEIDSNDIEKNTEENKKAEIQKAMYYALLGGNKKNFLMLLKYGGMVNESISNDWSEENYDTPLGVAIALNDFKLADEIIKLGGSINNIGYGLHYAIKYLKLKQVEYIVDKGGDINLKDSGGRPPLFYLVFSKKIYKEKVSNTVYKIIDNLESKENKIFWGEPNLSNEKNKKFNLLNGLLSAGNIKNSLIEYCLKKGGFLDSNNIHVRCTTVRMVQSLYNADLLENIEKYGLDIVKTNLAFNLMKNSFEGLKKIPYKPIISKLKEIRPDLDLNMQYKISGYNITYPVNILFYATVEREYDLFKYLIDNDKIIDSIPESLNNKFNSIYDYLLYLLLIDSYKYKKENINLNKEEEVIKMINLLISKGADPMLNLSVESDRYPLVLRFVDVLDIKKDNKNKSDIIKEKNYLFKENILNNLLLSPKINKQEILICSIIFYFKLLHRCSFEEEQLINNKPLYDRNKERKKESYSIVEKIFKINDIDKENIMKYDEFFKKALIYFLEKKENLIYNYLLTTNIVKNILINEKNEMLSKMNNEEVENESKKRRL